MPFTILKASPKDYQLFADIIQSVWQTMEQKEWFAADNADYTYHTLQEGHGIGYKAIDTDTGNTAAVFMVSIPGDSPENMGYDVGLGADLLQKVAHMDSVAVLPAYRGHHLQYCLMKTAENDLKKQGFRYLFCTVHPENHYSRNNIIKQGYAHMVTKEKYGGYLRDIFMKEITRHSATGTAPDTSGNRTLSEP